MSSVYILHFDRPGYKPQHYIGYTKNAVEDRLKQHQQSSTGFTGNLRRLGYKARLAFKFPGGNFALERQLKKSKSFSAVRYCPICNPGKVLPFGAISCVD